MAINRIRASQTASLVALGILFWLLAALFIRIAIPAGVFGGAASALLFALTLPAAWLLVWVLRRAASLQPDQLTSGVAVASAAALLCDGLALTWASPLYGPDPARLLPVAAWLLWGVGIILVLAFVTGRARA